MADDVSPEKMEVFLKSDWNHLFTMITNAGLAPAAFSVLKGTGNPGGGNLTHVPSGVSFSSRELDTHPAGFQLHVASRNIRSRGQSVSRSVVHTFDEFWREFLSWLASLNDYLTAQAAEESLPDLWKQLLEEPSRDAATIWQPHDVFTADAVADVRERVDNAFREIEERKLLTDELRTALREELDTRLPKVGQQWSSWRDIVVGYLAGKVMDGLIAAPVISVIINHLTGYLAAKLSLPVPPQLLP